VTHCPFQLAVIIISVLSTPLPDVAATKLQAKYRGYKAKGEFRKQKEAGKC